MNYSVIKTKKYLEKLKEKHLRKFGLMTDELICLRSKAYSFKCKDDNESNDKLKGISKPLSKLFKFEEYRKRLDGEDYQKECNKHLLRSFNQEMYLRKLKNPHYHYLMFKDVI